eukprot:2023065-Rhodomonas_salina.5
MPAADRVFGAVSNPRVSGAVLCGSASRVVSCRSAPRCPVTVLTLVFLLQGNALGDGGAMMLANLLQGARCTAERTVLVVVCYLSQYTDTGLARTAPDVAVWCGVAVSASNT